MMRLPARPGAWPQMTKALNRENQKKPTAIGFFCSQNQLKHVRVLNPPSKDVSLDPSDRSFCFKSLLLVTGSAESVITLNSL
jgi:hypothetical protein